MSNDRRESNLTTRFVTEGDRVIVWPEKEIQLTEERSWWGGGYQVHELHLAFKCTQDTLSLHSFNTIFKAKL